MSKSKLFLAGSLIFLVTNFIYLLYFANPGNSYFSYDKFYTFSAEVLKTEKKLDGWNITARPDNLENYFGEILIYTPLYPEYEVGQQLEVSCKIYKPEPIVDEQGKTFAYDRYLAKDNIFGSCFRPSVKIVGQHRNFNFYVLGAKHYLWQNLNTYLAEPASSLAKAIILADRREIPDQLRQNFASVGLSHVVAISGLHMAIIVWLLQLLLISLGLSRQQSFIWLCLILFLYLYIIGFPSSALRASLMMIIILLGPFLGRSSSSIYSLILVADIFVLLNPYVLLYDIGFQLSFLAVLGILFYVNFFNKVLIFIPKQFKIREVFSVSLAAQVFTWPIVIYNFGIFSLVAPMANFFVLPLLPFILVLSLVLAASGIWSWLAQLISWPLFVIFKVMTLIAKYLSKIPGAYLEINNFSLSYLFISLALMIVITIILKPHNYESD